MDLIIEVSLFRVQPPLLTSQMQRDKTRRSQPSSSLEHPHAPPCTHSSAHIQTCPQARRGTWLNTCSASLHSEHCNQNTHPVPLTDARLCVKPPPCRLPDPDPVPKSSRCDRGGESNTILPSPAHPPEQHPASSWRGSAFVLLLEWRPGQTC